jgi:hypothetical protein
MANARPPKLWHNFAGNIWAEGVRSSALFREVVLVMDCCRDLKNNATAVPYTFGDPVSDSKDCLMMQMYAADWDSKARELVFPPEEKRQGVFTRSLLAVLECGQMSGTVLDQSVRVHLANALKNTSALALPKFGEDKDLTGITFNEAAPPVRTAVVLTNHPSEPPCIESWPEGAEQPVPVNLDGWQYGSGAWKGTLAPGEYELRLPNGTARRLGIVAGVPKEVTL